MTIFLQWVVRGTPLGLEETTMADENRVTEVVNGAPVYPTTPITHEQLQGEFEYLTVVRFAKKLYSDGKITLDEFNKIKRKACEKFYPLYPEIRA